MSTKTQAPVSIKLGNYTAEILEGYALSFGSNIESVASFRVTLTHKDAKPGEEAAFIADRRRFQDAKRTANAYLERYHYHEKREGFRFEVAARVERKRVEAEKRVARLTKTFEGMPLASLDRIIAAATEARAKRLGELVGEPKTEAEKLDAVREDVYGRA